MTEDLITKVTQIINKPDGSQAKIVAQSMTGQGLVQSTSISVFKKQSEQEEWMLCNDQPASDFKPMSRQDYETHGRSEALSTVSTAQILKVSSLLGQSLQDCVDRGLVINDCTVESLGTTLQKNIQFSGQNSAETSDGFGESEDAALQESDQEGFSPAP